MSQPTPPTLRLSVAAPVAATANAGAAASLPSALLPPGSRSDATATRDELLGNVTALQSWDLGASARSADATPVDVQADTRLLALETVDGNTLFIRADALAERLDRLAATRPELRSADGTVDLTALRPRDASNRGVGEWVWRKVTALALAEDRISEAARDKLAELTGQAVEDRVVATTSRAGARALVWAIEERGRNAPGLYPWNGGPLDERTRLAEKDPRLADLTRTPGLIFIHGTGSHTLGGFGDLPGSRSWEALAGQFGGGIFGYEHHTFSESPIDNALALARVLPAGARFSIVTHSRGGLVGDLLCLDPSPSGDLERLIRAYRPMPRQRDAADTDLERFIRDEQAKLGELVGLLRDRQFRIERYVRVACPARGTALLSDNLEVFLSGLLNLIRRSGGWVAGGLAGAAGGPAAAAAAKASADKSIAVLTRIVLEIANRRLQPELLPGIEAMLPDSALGMLLACARARPGLAMGVIAGDIEGGGLAKRLGTMFTDWMFFDRANNDLVVDTASMYGGLAGDAECEARAIFVQGANVNHFRYFRDDTATSDDRPLPAALQRWLTDAAPQALPEWATPAVPAVDNEVHLEQRTDRAGGQLPIVVFLPGIMGSNLDADNARVWIDPLGLAGGELARIAMDSSAQVKKAGLVGMAYGGLARHLTATHQVEIFDYDWRQPLTELGKQLITRIEALLKAYPDTPLRILAHSMGGLVVRAAFAAKPELWDAIIARPEGRLVMLGTPNHGSHLFVDTLLGQSDTIRLLARVDLRHSLQEVLDIVAGFPGAVHLLPAPGFVDTGSPATPNYYDPSTWRTLAESNDDFWFGKHLGGVPTATLLNEAAEFWRSVADTRWVKKAPDRIGYVFGKSDNTPCGITTQRGGGIVLRGTPEGDGSVTWTSGHLADLPKERKWLMPVDHMGLTSTASYFDEIEALLVRGTPKKLGALPVSRGDGAALVQEYRAGPPAGFPSLAEATARLLGGRVRPAQPRSVQRSLKVSVAAMDLRFVQVPILCGHYKSDPIAAAEAVIDRNLVDGALSQRQRLGIHTGELGNAAIVLMPRTDAERKRRTGRGAVVIGLGEMGRLSTEGVSEAVRGGVLRYLLHAADRYGEELADAAADGTPGEPPEALPLKLSSLLIGTNSALQLDVPESIKAIVLGVLMANRDFAAGEPGSAPGAAARRAMVSELQFVEVFRDTAISAAYAVSGLGVRLKSELARLGYQIEAADQLQMGDGVRQRLSVSPFSDYWPRLVVCDADNDERDCPPEATEPRFQPPIPPEHLRQLLRIYGCADQAGNGQLPQPVWAEATPTLCYANRLKFIYMGDKARSESIVQIRQPGLVEKLCDDNLRSRTPTLYTPAAGFGNTLFQLLVPLDFKAAARQARNLLLMVDETTANLPWEMLETDGQPMVLQTRVVRQFMTTRFRRQVVRTDSMAACVIANPSTEGYYAHFGGAGWKPQTGPDGQPLPDSLPDLPGAAAEGASVAQVLNDAGYEVSQVLPDALAADVFTRLFARPYRILMVSAHGIHARRAQDGSLRSGVVLSGGLLITAAEIGQMECVPDIVFLNCCHLGKIGDTGGQRLAASLARELIEMGVRCVVAAGWEVNDQAARQFIETFFAQMAQADLSFGEALIEARRATFAANPDCNTWGAYQAYGDPSFQLKVNRPPPRDDTPMRAPDELIDWLEQRRLACRLANQQAPRKTLPPEADFARVAARVKTRLGHVPDAWTDLPEVQQTLARLYAEFGNIGFEAARRAYLRAVGEDSSRGLVPIAAIEQLANLEARQAEFLSSQAGASADAGALIDSAIARLHGLIALSAGLPALDAPDTASSPERWAILGGALKRKAVILQRSGAPWAQIVPLITEARDAYARCAGSPETQADWNPYNALNQVQLDFLLGAPAAGPMLEQCRSVADDRFHRNYGFFDAVMGVDAVLTACMESGNGDAAALLQSYKGAIRGINASRRERDSMLSQLRILADLLRGRDGDDDAARAALLGVVIEGLGDSPTQSPPAAPSPMPAEKGKEPGKAKPNGGANRKPKK